MSVFRSYFKKNNTLIDNNLSNNSQNPVTEISYGTYDKQVSRFIFDIDLSQLVERIEEGFINPNRIVKHVLHMTNTISYAPQYLGKKSYSENIERATGFELEIFNVNEDWNEGSGYEFSYAQVEQPKYDASANTSGHTFVIGDYIEMLNPELTYQASNWFYKKTGEEWANPGVYLSGETEIIVEPMYLHFEKGNENIDIDITDYINQRLVEGGVTGLTGTTAYTGASFGLGIKFADFYEEQDTTFRQAVAFHAKHTHTFYEPYIETIIDDTITDDRNYFYLDKDNDLYLYVNVGGLPHNDVVVNQVEIFDYEGNLAAIVTGDDIVNVSKGIYKITLNISSDDYPDAVLFRDVWSVTINGKTFEHDNEFYLISEKKYYTFDQSSQIEFDNYFFYFWGIGEKENIRAGNIRKVKLTIKELYPNQNNFLPLDIEYRLFTTLGNKYELDVIPFTKVDRTNRGYEFNLDTSWLIPQDYYLQIRLKNGNYFENKQTLSFTVVSDGKIFP